MTLGFTPIIIDEVVAAVIYVAAHEKFNCLIINLFNKNNRLPTCLQINKLIFCID